MTFTMLRGLILVSSLLIFCVPAGAQNSRENADFKLAVNLYNDGLYDLAAEQLKLFITTYPNTSQGAEARYYLGLTQLKLKQYDEARLTFQTFALTYQENPKAPEAWWNVGESYAALKNYREAALAFERVKVFHPKSTSAADALVQSGKYFVLAGQRDDARRVWRIVLQEYAGTKAVLAARTQLGQMYFEDGNLSLAQSELKRVVEGDPSPDARAQALLILGNISRSLGRTEQAQREYREIITKYGASSAAQGAYVNMGKLLSRSGNYDEAIENFRNALGGKNNADSFYVREALIEAGNAYAAKKDFSGAVRNYNLFLSSFPGDTLAPEVLWKSAGVNAHAGNYKRSNELCNQILKGNWPEPYKRRAQIKLALNAIRQKNPAQAVQHFETYLEQFADPVSAPEILNNIGTISERDLRDYRKAAVAYELVVNKHPESHLADDALAGAARCHELLKDVERALRLNAQLIAQYPSSDLRPSTEKHIADLTIFEARDKDAGLEKLTSLVGDMVAERDKEGLAFRLGEVYFHDLKNYGAAATQFNAAIESGLTGDRLADALFLRAKSLEFLSLRDESNRPRAVVAYDAFLASQAGDARTPDAVVARFYLSSSSLPATRTAYQAAAADHPELPRKDTLMLKLGMELAEAESTKQALAVFNDIAKQFPTSPSAEEAGFRMFMLLRGSGQTDSAVNVGFRYLSATPHGKHSVEITSATADILAAKGKTERALELYGTLTGSFSYTSAGQRARKNYADALLAVNRADEALPVYKELLAEQEDSPLREDAPDASLLLGIGNAYVLSGKNAEAKEFLTRCLESNPTVEIASKAYGLLGLIHQKEGSPEVASGFFRSAGTGTSGSRDIADLLFQNGNFADALRQYKQLAASANNDADRRYYDGRIIVCRLRSDDTQGIDKDIAAFSEKHKNPAEELASFDLEKGNHLYRKENYAEARKLFERVADKYDETTSAPVAMYWIGKVLESGNKPQDALKQYERLLKEYPNAPILPRTYLAMGNLHYNQEKWDEAVKNYRRIVDDPHADPELLPFALNNLIQTYEAAEVYDAALSLTRKYLELYPNSDDSFDKKIKIGVLYQRLGYNDQSALHLQALLDEAGSDLEGEIRYYIAEANYGKGDYQQAILDFLKVPYLVTKKGKIDWTANSLYMAGQSYEKMGRFDQALTMYQQILDRSGIDETFKAAARKEIERVKTLSDKGQR